LVFKSTRGHVRYRSLRPSSGAGGASVLREVARWRVTSPPLLQTVCDANPAENGLPQVCSRIGNLKRAGLWLHIR
jgi:hypothetical protein